jgi:hypothetical protein
MFVNTVLRKIFGPKRENVIGKSVKLHKAEFRDMYSLSNIINDQMLCGINGEEDKCIWDLGWEDLKERDNN